MIKIHHAHWDAIYIPESNKSELQSLISRLALASECNETQRWQSPSVEAEVGS